MTLGRITNNEPQGQRDRLDENPVDDGRCFACGDENPIGLHLKFETVGEGQVRARTLLSTDMQGWRGFAHGGIVMTLIDEVMAHAAGAAGQRGVSASMNIRFRRPVPLGVPIELRARVISRKMRVYNLEAGVYDADGAILAQGTGTFISRGSVEPGELGNPSRATTVRRGAQGL